MIDRVSNFGAFSRSRISADRTERMRRHLQLNDRVLLRYRGQRYTGRVVDLQQRAVIVSFELGGKELTEPLTYSNILKVLTR